LFAFWKSLFSQNLIDLYNQHTFIQTSRIIDYTDLFVIMLLPLPYLLIKRSDLLNPFKINKVHPMIMLLPTAFSLMATSPPRAYYYTRTDGNLRCYKCHFTVNYNQDEILALLKKVDIVLDTTAPACLDYEDRLYLLPYLKTQNTRYYKLNMLVIDKDTLRDIDFTLRTIKNKKTKIYFNGMNVPDDVSTWKLESKARKFYRRLLFEALKSKLED
jgi:hypothetical protein